MDAASTDPPRPVLIAALGHAWLRDQSFGIQVIRRLAELGVDRVADLGDWSFGTITAFQRLAGRGYRRAIFLSATERGRRRGRIYRFHPPAELPPEEEIHGRIGDCVMGLVSVDNLVIMARYFGELPEDVVLIEAEPVDDTWGEELSPQLARLLEPAVAAVLREVNRAHD